MPAHLHTPPLRMRLRSFILTVVIAACVSCSLQCGAAQSIATAPVPSAVSYALHVEPLAPSTQRLADVTADLTWTELYTQSELDACWPTASAAATPSTTLCFSRNVTTALPLYGQPSGPITVIASPSGFLWLLTAQDVANYGFLQNCVFCYYLERTQCWLDSRAVTDVAHFPLQGDTTEMAWPDRRLWDTRSVFGWGYASDVQWNVRATDMQWARTSESGINAQGVAANGSVLLIRASVSSWPNAAGVRSSLSFQLELHELSGEIVMHVLSLSRADAASSILTHPLHIGLSTYREAWEPYWPIDIQASMWLQRSYAPEAEVSATLTWTPYVNSAACNTATDCTSCLAIKPNSTCAWCAQTSSCVSTLVNASVCSGGALTSSCSPSELISCDLCVTKGYRWCSGDADCSVTQADFDNDPNLFPKCPPNPVYGNYAPWGLEGPGYCVRLDETCGAGSTCSSVYGADADLSCQFTPRNLAEDGMFTDAQCLCPSVYEVQSPALVGNRWRECTVCAQGAFSPRPGVCEFCPELTPLLVGGLVVVAGVVTFVLVRINSHPLFQKLLVPLQNSAVYFQVLSLLSLVDLHWPTGLRRVFTGYTIAGLNVLDINSIGCFMPPQASFVMTVVAPPLVGAMLLLCAAGAWIMDSLAARNSGGALLALELPARLRERHALFLRSFLSFLLIYYNHLAYSIFSALHRLVFMISWKTGPKLYPADHATQAICSAIIYLLGIPLVMCMLLRRPSKYAFVRHGLQCHWLCSSSPAMRHAALRPLTRNLRPGSGGARFWEALAVPLWKLVLNGLIVFGSRTDQVAGIALLLCVFLTVFSMVRPYAAGMHNREQQWLLLGSILVLLGGVLFYVSEERLTGVGAQALLVVSYLLVVVTMVAMLLLMAWVLFSVARAYMAEQKNPGADTEAARDAGVMMSPGGGEDDDAAFHEDDADLSDPAIASFSTNGATAADVSSIGVSSSQLRMGLLDHAHSSHQTEW